MATLLRPRLLSRRGLAKLAGAALVAVGCGVGRFKGVAALAPKRIYVFNPEWGAGQGACPDTPVATHERGPRSCHACNACHLHAANKRFVSRDAAERNRAHPGCRCRIEQRFVSSDLHLRMFGVPDGPDTREVFDLRWS